MSSTQTQNTPLRSWDDSLARVTGNTIPLWFPRVLESCRYRHEIWYWMRCNSQAMWSGKKSVTGRLWQGRLIAYNFVGWWKIWGTLGNPLSFLWIFFLFWQKVLEEAPLANEMLDKVGCGLGSSKCACSHAHGLSLGYRIWFLFPACAENCDLWVHP